MKIARAILMEGIETADSRIRELNLERQKVEERMKLIDVSIGEYKARKTDLNKAVSAIATVKNGK